MATIFKPLDDRLAAILETGYGAARTIPADYFRRSADRQSLLDPAYPLEWFDRAYHLEYVGLRDHDRDKPAQTYAPAWLVDVTVLLRVGYVYGAAFGPQSALAPASTETAAFAVLNQRARALSDAQRIWRAINYPDNVRTTTGDPLIADVKRVGDVALDDLGGGKLVATTTLLAILQLDPASAYLPSE